MHQPAHPQHLLSLLAGLVVLLPVTSPAQNKKYVITPAGAEFHPGNSVNTLPFSNVSARYQQVHDAADMQAVHAGGTMIIAALGFRPAAAYSIPARTWDVQINLAHTFVTSAQVSGSLNANLTTNPTTVLPYTRINFPAGQGQGTAVPNALLWNVPFKSLYFYRPAQGNLLWEWQCRNGTNANSFMDAVYGIGASSPTAGQNSGTGCTPTGRTGAATAQASVASQATLSLVNGPANAPAILWLGVQRQALAAGWCTSLYVSPLIAIPGMTDAAGTWNALSAPSSSLSTAAYWEVFAQFGFADPGLGGFGLSDLAAFAGRENRARHVGRAWVVSTTNGGENGAQGGFQQKYGLVTIFEIL